MDPRCRQWHHERPPERKFGREKKPACTKCGGPTQHCASQREAKRYVQLLLLLNAGEISQLAAQKRISLGDDVGAYILDFEYFDLRSKNWVREDTKGAKGRFEDPASKLRRKLAERQIGPVTLI